ncbi:methyltransferase domain-containing protein [Candidatus Micrarchaeota archaeon]|nr:methyltransferase domain-containing protein [Candidatus Micrarchaeota archaeon]
MALKVLEKDKFMRESSEWVKYAKDQAERPPRKTGAELISLLKEHGVRNVIDIGCGGGRNSIFLAKEGFDVTGVDFSEVSLGILKNKIKAGKIENIHLLLGEGNKIPVKDRTFDAATCHFVLDLQFGRDEQKTMINEIYRALKPNGVAVLESLFTDKEVEEVRNRLKNAGFILLDDRLSKIISLGEGRSKNDWVFIAEKSKQA